MKSFFVKNRKNILFSVISLIIFWVGVNLTLEVFSTSKGMFSRDLELGWVPLPDLNKHVANDAIIDIDNPDIEVANPYHIRTNSSGFRGGEVSMGNKKTFNIVCLGDSHTFGLGEKVEHIYTSILEKRLSSKRITQIFNLGVPAYSSYQGLIIFRKFAHKIRPDVVTISFGTNDPSDVRFRPSYRERPLLSDSKVFGESSKSLPFTFRIVIFLSPILKEAPLLSLLKLDKLLSFKKRITPPKPVGIPRVSSEEYRANITHILNESQRYNAFCVIIVISTSQEYTTIAREVADEHNVPLIDAEELFRNKIEDIVSDTRYLALVENVKSRFPEDLLKRYPKLFVTNDNLHPNSLGHRLIGDAVSDEILKHLQKREQPGN